jgi:hypothetical protein
MAAEPDGPAAPPPSGRADLLDLIAKIQANLTPDLLDPEWAARRPPDAHPFTGHCYVAAEALYHLAGAARSGLSVFRCTFDGGKTHWWLRDDTGMIYDPTAEQFGGSPPYHLGRRTGFLSREPSRRARLLIVRVMFSRSGTAQEGE